MASLLTFTRDLEINKNSTFQAGINLLAPDNLPFDLTGYSPRAQIRKNYSSPVIAEFDCHIADYASGRIYIAMTDEQTKVLPTGNCVYDVLIEDNNGAQYRVLEGMLTVNPYVTI
jgi:hypothetical protein